MPFTDHLNAIDPALSVEQRVSASCRAHARNIIDLIHTSSEQAARDGKHRIAGYLSGIGPVSASLEALGYNLHYSEDPLDFNTVYTDLECTSGNSNDPLCLSKELFDERVLTVVKKQLLSDGFVINALRSDCVQEYRYKTPSGVFRGRGKKTYTGTYGLYVYVDLSW